MSVVPRPDGLADPPGAVFAHELHRRVVVPGAGREWLGAGREAAGGHLHLGALGALAHQLDQHPLLRRVWTVGLVEPPAVVVERHTGLGRATEVAIGAV